MAEAESDPVASNLAQAALNSMLNAYSRSDSKESAATQLTGPPHATLQVLSENSTMTDCSLLIFADARSDLNGMRPFMWL